MIKKLSERVVTAYVLTLIVIGIIIFGIIAFTDKGNPHFDEGFP